MYLLGYNAQQSSERRKKAGRHFAGIYLRSKERGAPRTAKNVTKIHFFVKVVVTEYLLAGQVDLCNDFETLPSIV